MAGLSVSPLAPAKQPQLPKIAGVRLAGAAIGLKKNGGRDLMLAELAEGTTVAGALTRSLCSSAPVDWCRHALKGGKVRAIVVNSGNSNAFTGKAGDLTVETTVKAAAALVGCGDSEVFIASTGVIGQPLPPDSIAAALPGLVKKLKPTAWNDAADAIRTTDTFAKSVTRTATIDGVKVTINGIAKGSGMIAPDMATMLAFFFTDAAVPAKVLQKIVDRAVKRSFNSITVDSDTSTSDTVLFAATGAAGNHTASHAGHKSLKDFRHTVEDAMVELAQLIVRDGEGASKFVSIHVKGAASGGAARRVGLAIANSPLVKTAIAGEDANWGRIVMAVGKAGEKADRDRLGISIGGVPITRHGQIVDGYDETPVAHHMTGPNIDIEVDLDIGKGKATVWTCDLTHGYIDINGSYRS
ncbi:MAG TPA: bifunctional glutamate N-acetyltransferase/amino-acid acetyltransferase ArgJ [Alphaproteobacteria bacterium]|nr:bifunctional glutamate N-acetyltransferase/amino-acid acetyltransferase ArgJ [Alphaproteobacteria bacterium]